MLPPSLRRAALLTTVVVTAAAVSLLSPGAAVAAGTHFTGTVVSPAGAPVPDVFVTAPDGVGIGGDTAADGSFDFSNPGGITSHLLLCARLAQDAPQGGAAGWYDVCQYVDPGVPATLRFQPGSAIGGTVVDVRSGSPLAGATVSVFDNNDSSGYSVTTDANGRWSYRNLRPGTLNLVPYTASKVGADAPRGYLPVGTQPAPVVLRPGQLRAVDISVAPAVQYSGTVVDAAGVPVPDARVAVATYDRFTSPVDVADTDGAWSVLAPWSGVADVCTWAGASRAHPTGLAANCRVVTAAGTSVRANLRLTATGGALAGTVQAPDGGVLSVQGVVPLPSGSVLLLPAVKQGTTYTVAGLPRGTFRVRASASSNQGEVVAYSRERVVRPGAVSTFPTFALYTGGS